MIFSHVSTMGTDSISIASESEVEWEEVTRRTKKIKEGLVSSAGGNTNLGLMTVVMSAGSAKKEGTKDQASARTSTLTKRRR